MKSFRIWLEELGEDDFALLSAMGYSVVDKIQEGDMEMVLLSAPMFPPKLRFHLAFQRKGRSAANLQHQFSREDDKRERRSRGEGGVGIVQGYRALRPLMEKLVEWLRQYHQLVIASHNPALSEKWINNLSVASRYLGLPVSVETQNLMGHDIHFIKLS
jgi:hypothetical protein